MTRRRVRAGLNLLATVLVIAAAAVVFHFLPAPTQVYAPFDIHDTSGHAATGRALTVTVHGAQITPDVTYEPLGKRNSAKARAVGMWFVVNATVDAILEPVTPSVDLMVAGNRYAQDNRFVLEKVGGGSSLAPGIPQRGTFAFDVPRDLLESGTPLVFRVWVDNAVLDSRLVIDVNPEDVTQADSVRLAPPRVGA